VLAEIAQLGARGKPTAGELLDCLRQEDLSTVTGCQQP
jgi:hypothetical protein